MTKRDHPPCRPPRPSPEQVLDCWQLSLPARVAQRGASVAAADRQWKLLRELLDLAFLLGVTLVPFPAALLSAAPAEPDRILADARAGVVGAGR